ncbi:hypothetical protein A3Q56_04741, partial [Intoshia linei]
MLWRNFCHVRNYNSKLFNSLSNRVCFRQISHLERIDKSNGKTFNSFENEMDSIRYFTDKNLYIPYNRINDLLKLLNTSDNFEQNSIDAMGVIGMSMVRYSYNQRLSFLNDIWESINCKENITIDQYNMYLFAAVNNQIKLDAKQELENIVKLNINPNMRTFHQLLRSTQYSKDLTKISYLMEEAKQRHISVGEPGFNLIAQSYLFNNDLTRSTEIIKMIDETGMKYTYHTYQTAILMASIYGNEDKILSLLNDATDNCVTLAPNLLYENCIKLINNDKLDSALKIIKSMNIHSRQENNFNVGFISKLRFLEKLIMNNQTEAVFSLLSTLEIKQPTHLSTLEFDAFLKFRNKILNMGYMLDDYINIAYKAVSKNQFDFTMNLYKHMKKEGLHLSDQMMYPIYKINAENTSRLWDILENHIFLLNDSFKTDFEKSDIIKNLYHFLIIPALKNESIEEITKKFQDLSLQPNFINTCLQYHYLANKNLEKACSINDDVDIRTNQINVIILYYKSSVDDYIHILNMLRTNISSLLESKDKIVDVECFSNYLYQIIRFKEGDIKSVKNIIKTWTDYNLPLNDVYYRKIIKYCKNIFSYSLPNLNDYIIESNKMFAPSKKLASLAYDVLYEKYKKSIKLNDNGDNYNLIGLLKFCSESNYSKFAEKSLSILDEIDDKENISHNIYFFLAKCAFNSNNVDKFKEFSKICIDKFSASEKTTYFMHMYHLLEMNLSLQDIEGTERVVKLFDNDRLKDASYLSIDPNILRQVFYLESSNDYKFKFFKLLKNFNFANSVDIPNYFIQGFIDRNVEGLSDALSFLKTEKFYPENMTLVLSHCIQKNIDISSFIEENYKLFGMKGCIAYLLNNDYKNFRKHFNKLSSDKINVNQEIEGIEDFEFLFKLLSVEEMTNFRIVILKKCLYIAGKQCNETMLNKILQFIQENNLNCEFFLKQSIQYANNAILSKTKNATPIKPFKLLPHYNFDENLIFKSVISTGRIQNFVNMLLHDNLNLSDEFIINSCLHLEYSNNLSRLIKCLSVCEYNNVLKSLYQKLNSFHHRKMCAVGILEHCLKINSFDIENMDSLLKFAPLSLFVNKMMHNEAFTDYVKSNTLSTKLYIHLWWASYFSKNDDIRLQIENL